MPSKDKAFEYVKDGYTKHQSQNMAQGTGTMRQPKSRMVTTPPIDSKVKSCYDLSSKSKKES